MNDSTRDDDLNEITKITESTKLLGRADMGRVVRAYLHGRWNGLNEIIRLARPETNEAPELENLPVTTIRQVAHITWEQSLSALREHLHQIEETCIALGADRALFQPIGWEARFINVVLAFLEVRNGNPTAFFDALVDKSVVDTSIERHRLFDDENIFTFVGEKILEMQGVDCDVLASLPESIFPTFKERFFATWVIHDCIDLEGYFTCVRKLDAATRFLQGTAYELTGLPRELVVDASTVPMPTLATLHRLPLTSALVAAVQDAASGSTRLPKDVETTFLDLLKEAGSKVRESIGEMNEPPQDEESMRIIAAQLMEEFEQLTTAHDELSRQIRLYYLDRYIEILLPRDSPDDHHHPQLRVRCLLFVEGPSDRIYVEHALREATEGSDALGILVIPCGNKQEMPSRVMQFRRVFPTAPIICLLDADALKEQQEIDRMLRSAPRGSLCKRLGRWDIEDEFGIADLVAALNFAYPDGEMITVSDIDVNQRLIPQLENLVRWKKTADFEKVLFARRLTRVPYLQLPDSMRLVAYAAREAVLPSEAKLNAR